MRVLPSYTSYNACFTMNVPAVMSWEIVSDSPFSILFVCWRQWHVNILYHQEEVDVA